METAEKGTLIFFYSSETVVHNVEAKHQGSNLKTVSNFSGDVQSNVSDAAIITIQVSVDSKTVSVSSVLNLVIFRRKSKISQLSLRKERPVIHLIMRIEYVPLLH